MLEQLLHRRRLNLVGLLICAGLMGFALFVQYVLKLDPCPLCVFQRIGVIGCGIVFALAALHNPGRLGARLYGLLLLVPAGFGGSVAARHVWLQSLPPDQVPACGPGLNYMLENFPMSDALKMVFEGSGECAEIAWSFLGISMPGWVLVWMVILGLGGLLANFLVKRA